MRSLSRRQTEALCVLTGEWSCPSGVQLATLEALERRGLAKRSGVRWRLTEHGMREAMRLGSVAAVWRARHLCIQCGTGLLRRGDFCSYECIKKWESGEPGGVQYSDTKNH